MKITVKMSDTTVVICSKCHWSGAIEDAHWMQETEYGYCPSCGSAEFDDLESWEQADYGEEEEEWTWTGWKARVAVFASLVGIAVFIVVPWGFGVYHIVRNWIY